MASSTKPQLAIEHTDFAAYRAARSDWARLQRKAARGARVDPDAALAAAEAWRQADRLEQAIAVDIGGSPSDVEYAAGAAGGHEGANGYNAWGHGQLGMGVAGLSDIAERLGVPYHTVRGWRQRGLLDEFRVGVYSGRALYAWREVERWYQETPPSPGRPRKS
jgi:hypothetical protein